MLGSTDKKRKTHRLTSCQVHKVPDVLFKIL